ncbi:MAG: hypothetical protein O3B39_04765 [Proteobacteria bacterium]|nr:hypothetical protein [Pseudomonadota bacterium]
MSKLKLLKIIDKMTLIKDVLKKETTKTIIDEYKHFLLGKFSFFKFK